MNKSDLTKLGLQEMSQQEMVNVEGGCITLTGIIKGVTNVLVNTINFIKGLL